MDERVRELEMKTVGLAVQLQHAREELRTARLETGTVVYIVMDDPPHADMCVFTRFEDALAQAKIFYAPVAKHYRGRRGGMPKWDELKSGTEYWDTGDADYDQPPSVVVRREIMRGVISNWRDREEDAKRACTE